MDTVKNFFSEVSNKFTTSKFYSEMRNMGSQSFLSKALLIIGSYYFLRNTLGFLSWAKHYLFTFEKDFKKEYGDGWVVITGSTDGIGKELAIEFTKRSHKVLLVARNEEKLKSVCEELKKIPGYRDCSYVVFNLNRNYGSEDVNEIIEKFKSYKEDISILINNAGVFYSNSLLEQEYSEINDLINVNLKAPVFLTRTLLPFMNKKERKSLIVNHGSGLGTHHIPYSAIYCGTKAFLLAFSNSIVQEGYNVDVTYLSTNQVITNMNQGEGLTKIKADSYARQVMSKLGNYQYSKGHLLFSVEDFNALFFQNHFSPVYRSLLTKIGKDFLNKTKEEKKTK